MKNRKMGKFKTGIRNFCVLVFAVVSLCHASATETQTVFDKIIQNVVDQQLSTANIDYEDGQTSQYLSTLRPDGSFPDIDYKSTSQVSWAPYKHLSRLRSMAISYISPKSEYYGDEALHKTIINMLNYWYDSNPKSTNWFWQEVSWPQIMGVDLCLLRVGKEPVPQDLESKILKRMRDISKGPDQPGSQGSAANKMDIALQWIYRSTLQADKETLDFSVDQLYYPLRFNTGEGLQSDYSYLQHGRQLYIGVYGEAVLEAVLNAAFSLTGTEYERGEEMGLVSDFLRKAYIPAVRGRLMMYNAVGRSMACIGGTNRTSFPSILEDMKKLDPEYSDIYDATIKRVSGKESASYGLEPYHRHFWRADYTLHQRPEYTIDVRMATIRTKRCENGNQENLKGYFLTEGGTQIVMNGDEYHDIYPVWDWSRIPGTTTPALTNVPQPAAWGQNGQSNFAGGVSDGIYGVTTYKMVDNTNNINTSGKKSWFFFDKEIVCMGSDIRSSNSSPINTTVNQCLLNGKVQVAKFGGAVAYLSYGEREYDDLEWVNHGNVTYHFPKKSKLFLRNKEQQGTWNSITSYNDVWTVKKNVFKLWFDHGVKPDSGEYVYYIMPNTKDISEAKAVVDSLTTVNNDTIQAVYNHTLNILGAVFYKKGTLKIGDIELTCSEPCTAMFTSTNTENVKAYFSDPSYSLDSMNVYVKMPKLRYKTLKCIFNADEQYKGATSNYEIDVNTQDSIYVSAEDIQFDRSSLELSYDSPYDMLKAQVIPSNATNNIPSWSSNNENVAIVSKDGMVVAVGQGEAVITARINEQISASCTVTVSDPIFSVPASADAYVFDGKPSENYGDQPSLVVKTDGSGYTRRAYLMFSLPTAEDIGVDASIEKSKLLMYVTLSSPNAPEVNWNVYPSMSITWRENTIDWANKPTYSLSQLLDSKQCFIPDWTNEISRTVSFDVGDYVSKQYNNGRKGVTFQINQDKRASDGKGNTEFASKEYDNKAAHPSLMFLVRDYVNDIDNVSEESEVKAVVVNGKVIIYGDVNGRIDVYNTLGVKINARITEESSGVSSVEMNGLPTGIYIIRSSSSIIKVKYVQ